MSKAPRDPLGGPINEEFLARVIQVNTLDPNAPLPPPGARKRGKGKAFYYPNTPGCIGLEIVAKGAEKAALLVLAAHLQMHANGMRETALTKSVWAMAGLPDDQDPRRRTVLHNLKKIPRVLKITEERTWYARYRVAYGPLWAKGLADMKRRWDNYAD
jgi:hypothetical protein